MNAFACFNELSIHPLCQSDAEAKMRLYDFVTLLNNVRKHTGITKVRHAGDLTTIPLSDTMTLQDFCNKNMQSPQVIALLSMFVHPQVDTDDNAILSSYLDTEAEISLGNGVNQKADGFNAAYCQRTFCVGFDSHEVWHNDFFRLTVSSEGQRNPTEAEWGCISDLSFYSQAPEHRDRQPAFDRWLEGIRPVTLQSTEIIPNDKPINLRHDHGMDKLRIHAESLRNSEYVEGVLNSLPYKPHTKDYIARISDDGLVDVVLWWEDKGYSMRVKTTGRNAAETKEIAAILKKRYGKQ